MNVEDIYSIEKIQARYKYALVLVSEGIFSEEEGFFDYFDLLADIAVTGMCLFHDDVVVSNHLGVLAQAIGLHEDGIACIYDLRKSISHLAESNPAMSDPKTGLEAIHEFTLTMLGGIPSQLTPSGGRKFFLSVLRGDLRYVGVTLPELLSDDLDLHPKLKTFMDECKKASSSFKTIMSPGFSEAMTDLGERAHSWFNQLLD